MGLHALQILSASVHESLDGLGAVTEVVLPPSGSTPLRYVRLASDVDFFFLVGAAGLSPVKTTLALCPTTETVLLNVLGSQSVYVASVVDGTGTVVVTPIES